MIVCGDRRNLQKDKHHCNTPSIWALCWCGKTPSSLRHMKTYLEFTKEHLKDPQTVRNNIIWSDEPQFQASCSKGTSSAHHLQSTIPKVKCSGSSLMLWGCFSVAGTERLVRVLKKLRRAEGLPSNRTMDLNTQQEWLIDNSVNVLEWPSQSLSLNPIKYIWKNLKMCVCPHPT